MLLTSRQRSGRLVGLVCEDREQLQHFVQALAVALPITSVHVGPHHQVLHDAHLRKQFSAFGTLHYAAGDDRAGFHTVELFVFELDLAGRRLYQATNGIEQAAFTGAIGPE